MSLSTLFQTIEADVIAFFNSPVGKTLDNIAATAAGAGTVIGLCSSMSDKKQEIANQSLIVEGILSQILDGTTSPSATQIAGAFDAFKSTDPVIFQMIATTVSAQLFTVIKTYDGSAWKDVVAAYLNGVKVGCIVMGAVQPAPTPA